MNVYSLARKEIRSSLPSALVFLVVIFGCQIYVHGKQDNWDALGVLLPAVIVPMLLLPIWAMIVMYRLFSMEWRSNAIYLLLPLPIRGWQFITAKLVGMLSGWLLVVVAGGISALFLVRETIDRITASINSLSMIVVFSLLGLLVLTLLLSIIVVFAYLSSRLVRRFRFACYFLLLILTLWGLLELSTAIASATQWLPSLQIDAPEAGVISLRSSVFLAQMFFAAGLFYLCAWIYDAKLEVK